MNIIQKQQQRELQKIDICVDIIKNARNELYLSMRFFDITPVGKIVTRVTNDVEALNEMYSYNRSNRKYAHDLNLRIFKVRSF